MIYYVKSLKTEDIYAFSMERISDATGISLSMLPYTTLIKIPTIRFILLDGRPWFTTVTLKERSIELLNTYR